MKKLLLLLVLVSLRVFAGVPLSTNFTLNTALPLDDRAQVTNLTARNALPALRRWEGMLVYVKSEKKHFTLVDGIADINWTELSGSGGGGISEWEPSTDYKAKDLVLQNGEIFQAINDFTSGVSFDPADFTPISKYVTADVVPDPGKITFWKSNDPYGLLDSGTANLDTSGNLSGLNNVTILGDTTLKTSLTGFLKGTSGLVSSVSAIDLSLDVVGTLPINRGGTGSTSQSWVDLTSNQGGIAGNKSFTGTLTVSTPIAGSITGNAGTVTTNANMTGAVTSVGNTTSLGSFTSANLAAALTNETGTGTAVFNTSPALVTPNIGAATGTSLALGGTINANAIADFQSTTKAFMSPRMTTAQKNAIASPTAGMEVFDTDLGAKSFYNGTQWISNLVIAGDTVYSAQLASTTGAISNQTGSWLSSCSRSGTNTGIITCVPTANRFTVTPNCGGSVNIVSSDQSTVMYDYGSSTATSLVFHTATPTTPAASAATLTNAPLGIWCQKSGADYANSSTSGILASNADTSWSPCTFSTLAWQGLGTVTNNLRCKRSGEDMLIRGSFTTGAVSATMAQIPIPNNWGSVTSSSAINVNEVNSDIFRSQPNLNTYLKAIIQPSASYFNISGQIITAANNPSVPVVGNNPLGNSETAWVPLIRIPIAGWSQSPIAIIPLAGTATVPGYTGQVDSIAVSYGTTNATTVCSASPCSYLDQIGTGVSSVTRTGTGVYFMNTARTYSKLKCVLSILNAGFVTNTSYAFSCNNCSSLEFRTYASNASTVVDSVGTLICSGAY